MSKAKTAETPLMQQHGAIKARYPDAILLFRVGDFYETFGQDAVITAQVLGITLTKRNNGAAASSELAGFPHHALDTYLHKLVKAGYRVAVCDQLEDPKAAKGIVKRGVTEMVTPGTATGDKMLDGSANNFLAALHIAGEHKFGIAFLDLSTGEFFIAEGDKEYADKLLTGFNPSEVIFQRQWAKKFREEWGSRWYTYLLDEWVFAQAYAKEALTKQFEVRSLKGFGVDDLHNGLIAAGAILHYLKDTEHPNLQHLTRLQRLDAHEHLWMDRFTVRNLELVQPAFEGGRSLLSVLDNTASPMGARLLRRWIHFPLVSKNKIEERLLVVEDLIKATEQRLRLVQYLKACGDVERLVSKIPLKKISPRELLGLAKGLKQIALVKEEFSGSANSYLKRLADALNPCTAMADKIVHYLIEHPPAAAQKGGFINPHAHVRLAEWLSLANGGKDYLQNLQQQEAATTGITSLKIGYTSVFGYYLEVTNAHKTKVPPTWQRKQTLANAERYITPELKEYEEKIMQAEEKALAIELELFDGILNELHDFLSCMQQNAQVLAVLDCLCCFAQNAIKFNYRKPQLTEGDELKITAARHPVIERGLPPGEPFIANDICLDREEQQIIILTGPNMSGKSALLRQTALITLMAHVGSFVPADAAVVPITDKLFTRVGASDNLSGGESTFMVEMNETAAIINNLSERSLVLLDEIGRGTSTYDGISIAWSIVEHLAASTHRPKTFFATHYHELNELEGKLPSVKNYHITHKEAGNKIIFLRKLAPGGSTHSFGIHVARMAGMPSALIQRAEEVLALLEQKPIKAEVGRQLKAAAAPRMQLSIFDAHSATFEHIRSLLESLDINRLTPVEALLKLAEIKKTLN